MVVAEQKKIGRVRTYRSEEIVAIAEDDCRFWVRIRKVLPSLFGRL